MIVQDSRNDFLAWDRVRNLANRQETVLVSVADGTVREVLSDARRPSIRASPRTDPTSRSRRPGARRHRTPAATAPSTSSSGWRSDAGAEPESLRDTGEERLNVSWNGARDAFAYADEGSVFVRRLDDDEAVDVTEGHRPPAPEPGARAAEADPDP